MLHADRLRLCLALERRRKVHVQLAIEHLDVQESGITVVSRKHE